jgi:hypothetical protein
MISRDCEGAIVWTCSICGGDVTHMSSQGLSVDTPYGHFVVHFHQACYNKETHEIASKKLFELVDQAKAQQNPVK